jgi:8-oxo-dGTP diphosphatase
MSEEEIAAIRGRYGSGPHVCVDLVIFTLRPDVGLSILLIERGIPPWKGLHALPGGFVRADESLEAAARRELGEETGVSDLGIAIVEQLATFGDPGRDPRSRTVSVAHTALVPHHRVAHVKGGDDAASAAFHRVIGGAVVDEQGRPLPLAFDHEVIVRAAVERLRARVTYTTAPFVLMPDEFTLAELQAAYEAILGTPLHRRAFRERIEREGWVVATGGTRNGAHRPARLFRAATRELVWMRPWPEAAKIPGTLPTRATLRARTPRGRDRSAR